MPALDETEREKVGALLLQLDRTALHQDLQEILLKNEVLIRNSLRELLKCKAQEERTREKVESILLALYQGEKRYKLMGRVVELQLSFTPQ